MQIDLSLFLFMEKWIRDRIPHGVGSESALARGVS
jgi:hypothetical protein